MLLFALAAWTLLGWGTLITRLFRMRLPAAEARFSRLWLGLALTLLVLQLVNYFAPINWIVTIVMVVGGLVAWWFNWRITAFPLSTPRLDASTLLYTLAVVLSAGWITLQSMQPATLHDTGYYHLQTIRWFNEYAIVPGLGNLYGRLAYNQSFLAFVAALNVYPFFNYGYALANGFLILLLAAEGWHALIFQRQQTTLTRFAALCALPIAAYMTVSLNPASPSPTTASTVLQFIIWLHFARLLEQNDDLSDGSHACPVRITALPSLKMHLMHTRTHVLLLLAVTAFTIQPGNLIFVAAIALIVLLYYLSRIGYPVFIRTIIFFRLTWLAMLLLVVWMGRGYFLSGYPIYPSTAGSYAVDWTVPHFSVEAEADLLSVAAKYGSVTEIEEGVEDGWAWVGPWLGRLTSGDGIAGILYPFTLTLLLLILYCALRIALYRGRIRRKVGDAIEGEGRQPPYRLLALPILVALGFWWLNAPDPTLVYALFWLLTIIMAHALLTFLGEIEWSRPSLRDAVAFLAVNVALLVTLFLHWPQAVALSPGFAPLPIPDLIEQRLPRRLTIWTPSNGELCWNSRLPCTPYVNPQLRRRGGDIQHGFQVLPQYRNMVAMAE